jgi:hypothetical protein
VGCAFPRANSARSAVTRGKITRRSAVPEFAITELRRDVSA